jgi:glycosyltransferase involved in cell wall biosynthesis
MRILMIGAGDAPPTFIARMMHTLAANGIEVATLPAIPRFRRVAEALSARGISWLLPRAQVEAVLAADVVHFQWPGHHALYASLLARVPRPTLLSLRGRQANILPVLPGHERHARNLRRSVSSVTAVHAVSQQILEDVRELGARPQRAFVIRPAVNVRFFAPPAERPPATPLRVAMVGALTWRKAYEDAILGIAGLKRRGVAATLAIVGEGPDRPRLERAIADLDVAERVFLLGKRGPDDVRALLQESHVLLLSSLSEGIANSALEGMAVGLAVVATRSGGMHEVITDGVDGLLVAPRDPGQITEALRRLAVDPAWRAELGEASRARVVAHHDLEEQGQQFLAAYRALASGG